MRSLRPKLLTTTLYIATSKQPSRKNRGGRHPKTKHSVNHPIRHPEMMLGRSRSQRPKKGYLPKLRSGTLLNKILNVFTQRYGSITIVNKSRLISRLTNHLFHDASGRCYSALMLDAAPIKSWNSNAITSSSQEPPPESAFMLPKP